MDDSKSLDNPERCVEVPATAAIASSDVKFPNPNQEWTSPAEFCQLTGLSLATVRRYLDSGKLPKIQLGGPRSRVLIPRDAAFKFLGAQMTSPHSISISDHPDASAAADQTPRRSSGPTPRWLRNRKVKDNGQAAQK